MELIWNIDRSSENIANLVAVIDGQKNDVLFLRKTTSGYSTIPLADFDFLKPIDISFEEIRIGLEDEYDSTLSYDDYELLELADACYMVGKDFEKQVEKMLKIH